MSKFKIGDTVRLTSEARERYRDKLDSEMAELFVDMVLNGAKAVVSSYTNEHTQDVWLNNNQFFLYKKDLVLACQAVAVNIHSTVDEMPVEVQRPAEHDVVKKPRHYAVIGEYEVKDINKAILDSMEEEGFDITLYEAGWFQQAMQYFMRGHKKGGLEDYKKGIQTMQFVVDSMEERNERKG